jgi:hypothetical protein
MIGGIIRCAFLADCANECWSAIGSAAAAPAAASARRWWSMIRADIPSKFAGPLVCPLPYTHSSFGMEILVLGNAGEIMERIASKRAEATSLVLSKCRQNEKIESAF